jgi:lipocalin-like protein
MLNLHFGAAGLVVRSRESLIPSRAMQRTLVLVLCALVWSTVIDRIVLAQQRTADVLKRLSGHWRLVTFVNFDESGTSRDAGYEGGRITYDEAGNMSAQLTRVNRRALSQPPTEAERAAAYSSYIAYYGKVTIDPAESKVTHHVEGSVNPNWVKTDLVRYYEFSPDSKRLMLSIQNAQGRVTGKLTWERID